MNVCVIGLWHLGTVMAACLASVGHSVTGFDQDLGVIERLQQGQPPLFEPGLEDLLRAGMAAGRLRFTADPVLALSEAEIAWVAFDTPVDEDDQADVDYVMRQVSAAFPYFQAEALVLISSQLPVGSTAQLEKAYRQAYPQRSVRFGYSPENLRLGKAINVFMQPDRVVVGVRNEDSRQRVEVLMKPITERIEWMSVESAEMTKHALNSFLALSVVFANEVAALCERVGADAKEVERGLKTETRIGPGAYLGPGAAFAGGTLARDLTFLKLLSDAEGLPGSLFAAALESNEAHRNWPRRRLIELVGDLRGKTIAVLGLTYKPGTDTLRRSGAVELCRWLARHGARVQAHDPAVRTLPEDLAGQVALCGIAVAALRGAEVVVVATGWPEYRDLRPDDVIAAMGTPLVLDAAHFLTKTLGADSRIRYYAVGKA